MLAVETVTVAILVLLGLFLNICTVLVNCWSLCGGGENDAGNGDDRCVTAADGANSGHLRCIMAPLFHVKNTQWCN